MDPYGIELGVYSQIENHFLANIPGEPAIVHNSGQAARTLNSLCKEMDHRYKLLSMALTNNIKEYNKKFRNHLLNPEMGHEYMPYIVVIIDEYGDFMTENSKELESFFVLLAQSARSVGIHMIISTKRPTNEIITSAVKANFPTRISFRVPERIDSQVILDCNGAENLLGDGDMLFRAGKTIDCIRIQGAFVDVQEIEDINQYISGQQSYLHPFYLPDPYYNDSQENMTGDNDVGITHFDPMFADVAKFVVNNQSGSTSMIQRNYSIGYNRAGKIMDQLERMGVVGPQVGAKPREVLIQDEMSLEKIFSQLR